MQRGSDGGFLEEAVEGLFGGAVRGLWRFMELRASQKKTGTFEVN